MAEPGKATAPPQQEAGGVGDGDRAAAASGPDHRTRASELTSSQPPSADKIVSPRGQLTSGPALEVEPEGEIVASPLMALEAAEAIGDGEAAPDLAPRTAALPEPDSLEAAGETPPVTTAERVATPPPPPPMPKAADAGKQLSAPRHAASPEPSSQEAAGETPPTTKAEEVATPPPPTEAPPPEAADAGKQLPAPPPQQQKREDSSVHEAGKDAAPAPAHREAAVETPPATKMEGVSTPPPPTEAPPLPLPEVADAGKQLPAPPPPLPESADAGKQLPAPPPQQQKREDSVVHEAGKEKDAAPAPQGKAKSARGLWAGARAAVLLAFHRPKVKDVPPPEDKGGDTKPAAPAGKQPSLGKEDKKPASAKKPNPMVSVCGGKSLSRRDEGEEKLPTGSQAGVVDGGAAAGKTSAAVKRFQRIGREVLRLMSLYRRHRSSSSSGDGKGGDTMAPEEEEELPASELVEKATKKKKQPHPKWPQEEERLEGILEGAFTKLLAREYSQLSSTKQKCLLTFSVFHLDASVKKQSMLYWWVSEFNLLHRRKDLPEPGSHSSAPGSPAAAAGTTTVKTRCRPKWRRRRNAAASSAPPAEGSDSPARQGKAAVDAETDTAAASIFSELARLGFLEPTEQNRCTGAIHGCKVNPLVHWMVKHQARYDRFADLDGRGNPADGQPESAVLCLTAGNRAWLQEIATEDEALPQAGDTPQERAAKGTSEQQSTKEDGEPTKMGQQHVRSIPNNEQKENLALKRKEVIININAHVYRLSKSLLSQLPENLVVLQLGQWWSHDDRTYMEVEGLDSLCAISNLKNLRYLSLRGLSRLTNLPKEMKWAKNLTILDLHGCQNLERVVLKTIPPPKKLTHLDLSDCYMLEYIDKGVTSFSELQVFKGFVFGVGKKGTDSCSLQDLKKLKKLEKLTISITTDATIGKRTMEELKNLSSLRSLTVTWGELPSILADDAMKKEREAFLKTWTSLELPPELLKLDIRCYPNKVLVLKQHKKLNKLYIRGGEMEELKVNGQNHIKILRLRYLKKFNMKWESLLATMKDIEYVEIMVTDNKVFSRIVKDKKEKGEAFGLLKAMIEEQHNLMDKMKIPDFTLDENGVWVRDKKEEENQNLSTGNYGGSKKEVEDNDTIGDAKKEVEGKGTIRDNTSKEVEDRSTMGQRKDASKDLDNTKEDDGCDAAGISQLESKEEVMHSSRRSETAHNGPDFHSKSNEIVNDTNDAGNMTKIQSDLLHVDQPLFAIRDGSARYTW
ncbi:hypothetical protein ACP4OV_005855 [Aristida adscensionis]